MKKLLQASVLIVSSVIASQAISAEMECYVDTQQFDNFTPSYCVSLVWGAQYADAIYRVSGANKAIDKVIWEGVASGKGCTGTSCTVSIRAFRPSTAKATVLYTDGTWESVSATAELENGL